MVIHGKVGFVEDFKAFSAPILLNEFLCSFSILISFNLVKFEG